MGGADSTAEAREKNTQMSDECNKETAEVEDSQRRLVQACAQAQVGPLTEEFCWK